MHEEFSPYNFLIYLCFVKAAERCSCYKAIAINGLFFNSPFAKRFEAICGVTPHSVGRCRAATKGTGLLSLPHTPPEALPLDSAKGTQSLWNPIHWYKDFFDRLRGSKCSPLILLLQKVQKRLYMPCDQLQYSNTTEVHKSPQSLNEYVLWRQLLLQLYTVCSCCSERFKICYRQIRLSKLYLLWAHKLYMAILEQLTSASNYYLYRVN